MLCWRPAASHSLPMDRPAAQQKQRRSTLLANMTRRSILRCGVCCLLRCCCSTDLLRALQVTTPDGTSSCSNAPEVSMSWPTPLQTARDVHDVWRTEEFSPLNVVPLTSRVCSEASGTNMQRIQTCAAKLLLTSQQRLQCAHIQTTFLSFDPIARDLRTVSSQMTH